MASIPVPSNRFYGPSTKRRDFIPPIARASPAARAALAASKAATRPPVAARISYPTQAAAFAVADASTSPTRVWGLELDSSGRRRFLVATTETLWAYYRRLMREGRRAHIYEIIRRGAVCKAYFDLEFAREGEARLVDGDALTEEVVQAVGEVAAEWTGRAGWRPELDVGAVVGGVVRLLSSTPEKYSVHLVFPALVFSSNAAAGDFAREVEARLGDQARGLGLVDMGVYTPNRCFRLVGSSKFGREQRLLPAKAYYSAEGRPAFSEQLFRSSLVTEVADTKEFVDAGAPETILPLRSAGSSGRSTPSCAVRAGVSATAGHRSSSDCPAVDGYIQSIIQECGGRVASVSYLTSFSTISYVIKGGWRFCYRIGRHHKSNGIVLVVNLASREVYQRCFDPDCRGFRSEPWALPAVILPAADVTESHSEDGKFDEELVAFMEDWESSVAVGGAKLVVGASEAGDGYFDGLSDDALMEIELPVTSIEEAA